MTERKELIEQLRMDYTASPMALTLMRQAADMLAADERLCKTCRPVCVGGEGCFAGCPPAMTSKIVAHGVAPKPPLTDDELTEMWLDAKKYANPTAADAHLRYARAIEKKVRGEA